MTKTLFTHVRALIIALVLGCAGPLAPAIAQTDQTAPTLDTLFDRLQSARTTDEGARISAQIWQQWLSPDDPELEVLINRAVRARSSADVARAFVLLERIIRQYPDYAEGWNQRATLHYQLGNYERSLADIEATLEREPRHFGALSGRALVYLAIGDRDKARDAVEEASEINPFITDNPAFGDLVEPTTRL